MTRFGWLVMVLLLLVGCVGWPSPQSNATDLGDLALVLWTSHKNVNVNQPVTIRFTVRNEGKQAAVYDSGSNPVADIIIGPPWVRNAPFVGPRWSDGKPLTPDVTGLVLQPGQSKTLEMEWIPAASVYGAAHAVARYIHRFSWGDDTVTASAIIDVQSCPGPLP